MEFGLFNIPFAPGYASGDRSAKEVIDWDLQLTKWCDELGIDEVFFAEHYTIGGEPSPAPDAMIAAASQITSKVRLGAAAHLIPYHNPVALAHRMMWLDHMTGGRYIAGVAPGAFPSDAALFGTGKNNTSMMLEGLDIIEAVLTRKGPFSIEGEYFSVNMPEYDAELGGPHLAPLQQRIPMMVTGMSENSKTIEFAGSRGYFLLSQQVHEKTWRNHWDVYAESALRAGLMPQSADWRVCRDIFVADTDAEAVKLVREGATAAHWANHNLPTFKKLGIAPLLTGGTIDSDDLSVDWMIDNFLIVGSPDTVVEKIQELYSVSGGFGTLVTTAHEYTTSPEEYRHNLELMGGTVKSRLAHLPAPPE